MFQVDGQQIFTGDHVVDICFCAKLHYDSIRGFAANICEVVYQMITRLFFIFGAEYAKKRRFAQARTLLGPPKTRLYVFITFSP